jgi:hypothetical protein
MISFNPSDTDVAGRLGILNTDVRESASIRSEETAKTAEE